MCDSVCKALEKVRTIRCFGDEIAALDDRSAIWSPSSRTCATASGALVVSYAGHRICLLSHKKHVAD